jgi:membrane-bound lytic murein transglycosylase D
MNFTGSRLFLLLIAFSFSPLAVHAQLPAGFPVAGIEDRIEFWEKVFTLYGADDLIIHDTQRVDLIYDVVDERSRRSGTQRVRSLLDEVQSRIATPDQLSADARVLYDRIEADGVRMTAGDIAVLRGRVHVQRGIKERFESGVVLSGRYLEYFEEVFEDIGVPTVIALLPLVESSFENAARSYAGAVGIWQFMPATGRQFMTVQRGRDDRTNPAIATRSAARLLSSNYQRLRSWPLAITAYNHGTTGMARARAAHGSDMATIIGNYNSRTFGYASMNFYAEFIAAVNVYDTYETHFGPIALDAPLDFTTPALRVAGRATISPGSGQTYQVRSGDTLSLIAERHGSSISEIMSLNRLPSDRIFAGETLLVSSNLATGANGEYQVQRGDTLSHIAERFGMRLGELMSLNGLRAASTIYAGQLLIVQ